MICKIKMSNDNRSGFSMVELLVVVAIFSVLTAGVYVILSTGQSAWFDTDTRIELQENLRLAADKMIAELQQTGTDQNGVMQLVINDNTGVSGTDVVKFSIPVICHAGDNIMDVNSNVAHWGAPLTWGCTSSTCMDTDNDCATIDYKDIRYELDNNAQLIRKVLDDVGATVRQDILARNVIGFQAALSVDQHVLTVTVNVQRLSALRRLLSAAKPFQIYLRNRG